MAAGGPGDHPLTDILDYKLPVFDKECDDLVSEISRHVSRDDLFPMFDWFRKSNFTGASELKIELKEALGRVIRDGKAKGWENISPGT